METNHRELKEQIKLLLADKLELQKQKQLIHDPNFEKKMKEQWKEEDEEDFINPVIGQRVWKRIKLQCQTSSKKPIRNRKFHWSIASSAVAAILLGFCWFYSLNSDQSDAKLDQFVKVTTEDSQLYLLPDSSKVWMHPGSSIRFPREFSQNREVWLTGSSHFDVRKQKGKNFIVYIQQAFIEVKGTSFLVNQDLREISKVSLFSGSISFTPEGTSHSIEIKPTQNLIYNRTKNTTVLTDMKDMTWRNGYYEFINADLRTWAGIVEHIYSVKIHLEQKKIMTNKLNGRIRYNESIEDLLEKICYSIGGEFQKEKEGEYIIHY